jgi:hypothetical protein
MISHDIIIEKAAIVDKMMSTMNPQEQVSFLQSLLIAKIIKEIQPENDKLILTNFRDNLASVRSKIRKAATK